MDMPAKIIIGADLVPTESNYNYFKGCETEYLIGKKITEKLNNADFTIFNLEVPLTDKKILLINVALIYLHLPIQLQGEDFINLREEKECYKLVRESTKFIYDRLEEFSKYSCETQSEELNKHMQKMFKNMRSSLKEEVGSLKKDFL